MAYIDRENMDKISQATGICGFVSILRALIDLEVEGYEQIDYESRETIALRFAQEIASEKEEILLNKPGDAEDLEERDRLNSLEFTKKFEISESHETIEAFMLNEEVNFALSPYTIKAIVESYGLHAELSSKDLEIDSFLGKSDDEVEDGQGEEKILNGLKGSIIGLSRKSAQEPGPENTSFKLEEGEFPPFSGVAHWAYCSTEGQIISKGHKRNFMTLKSFDKCSKIVYQIKVTS